MKKLSLILALIMVASNANATQMCARRDTTVIPLDGIPGGQKVNNATYWNDRWEWVWYAQFEYGRIYGAATCLSVQDIREIQGKPSLANYVDSLVTDEDEIQGRDGYYNGDDTNTEYERKFCYCKLTHPMSSRWVFQVSYDAADCSNNCAYYCANYAFSDVGWRSALFRAVGD